MATPKEIMERLKGVIADWDTMIEYAQIAADDNRGIIFFTLSSRSGPGSNDGSASLICANINRSGAGSEYREALQILGSERNAARAGRAMSALRRYKADDLGEGGPAEAEDVADLLTDMMHLCAHKKWDAFAGLLLDASEYYRKECALARGEVLTNGIDSRGY